MLNTWNCIAFEGLLCSNEMGDSGVHVSRELPSICPNPLWDLFTDTVFELAYYRGMNFLERFPHLEFTLLYEN